MTAAEIGKIRRARLNLANLSGTLTTENRWTMSEIPGVPIDALFDVSGVGPNRHGDFDAREALNAASIIIGRDVMTRDEFILYGRETIERLARGEDVESSETLCVELDQGADSEDLERIIVLIETIKGQHDYRSFDEDG